MLHIKKAEYQGGYKIFLQFDNGKKGIVDLENYLFAENRSVFHRIRDIKQFQNFSLDPWTVIWGGDLDLAPEFLHDLLIKQNKK
jgi:hypothetical protein